MTKERCGRSDPHHLTRLRQFVPCLALLTVAIFVPPATLSTFRLFQFTGVLIYAVGLLGMVVLTGRSGILSFGQGAFFAVGAYATAILITKLHFPYGAALPVSALITLLMGVALGIPAIRLSNVGLAMMTVGVVVALPPFVKRFPSFTNGSLGIGVDEVKPPFGLAVDPQVYLYVVCLIALIGMVFIVWSASKGRTGRAWDAMRENDIAATAMGVNVRFYKLVALALSAFAAGLAGGLYVLVFQFISPDTFSLFFSFILVVALIVGGSRSLLGPVLGGLFIVYTPQLVARFGQSISTDIPYGLLLVVLVWISPDGVIPGLSRLISRIIAAGKASLPNSFRADEQRQGGGMS